MESTTGVHGENNANKRGSQGLPDLKNREDAAALDYSADWEQLPSSDVTSVYWELVDEGKDPIVPGTLEALAQKKLAEENVKLAALSVRHVKATTFVDVGPRFEHTHHKKAKKASKGYKGPHWVPEFTV